MAPVPSPSRSRSTGSAASRRVGQRDVRRRSVRLPARHHPFRYGEVDMQGVVFNATTSRTWTTASTRGCARSTHFERFGWDIMVKKASVEWLGSAGIGDVLTLRRPRESSRWGRTTFDVSCRRCGRGASCVRGGRRLRRGRDRDDDPRSGPRRGPAPLFRVQHLLASSPGFYRRDPRTRRARTCSTRCWSVATLSTRGSSRSRRTADRSTPVVTRTAG